MKTTMAGSEKQVAAAREILAAQIAYVTESIAWFESDAYTRYAGEALAATMRPARLEIAHSVIAALESVTDAPAVIDARRRGLGEILIRARGYTARDAQRAASACQGEPGRIRP